MTDHEPTAYFTRNTALEAKRPDRRATVIEDKSVVQDMGGGRKKVFKPIPSASMNTHRPAAIKRIVPRVLEWLQQHPGWHTVYAIQHAKDLGMHIGGGYTKEITAALLADPNIRRDVQGGKRATRLFQHRYHGDNQ